MIVLVVIGTVVGALLASAIYADPYASEEVRRLMRWAASPLRRYRSWPRRMSR